MEMEYRDPSHRGRVLIIAGVILAVVAGMAAFFILNQGPALRGSGEIKRTPAVVAAKPIAARAPIQESDVTIRDVPVDPSTSAGLITAVDKVIGRVSTVAVAPGQLVLSNGLASAGGNGGLAILEPTETVGPNAEAVRAVSVTVPAERATGGLIEVGQTVDVIATATVKVPDSLTQGGRYYTDRSTKVVYQNMVILARNGDQYVVRAGLAVAEEISHLVASDSALFSLVLRPEIDVRIVDVSGLGATTNRIIVKYGLPVPEVYPGSGAITPGPTAQPRPSSAPSGGAASGASGGGGSGGGAGGGSGT